MLQVNEQIMELKVCYHCGDNCTDTTILLEDKPFCCQGCKTVYEILSESDLTCYYDLQSSPGAIPKEIEGGKYDFYLKIKLLRS